MASGKGVAVAAVILAAGMIFAGCKKAPESGKDSAPREAAVSPASPGQAIPFSIKTFDGKTVALQDFRGRPVVVNFFASWCGPCQLEAPALGDAYKKFGDKVQFVGVAIEDSDEGARGFVREYGIKFPSGLDSSGEIMKAYNIFGIPKTYFIDRDGRVVHEHSGMIMRDDLEAAIRLVL